MRLLGLLVLLPSAFSLSANGDDIVTSILNNYEKRSSPYNIRQEKVNVTLAVPFMILLAVTESERKADWLYSYTMAWHDERLRFNSSEFGQDVVFIPESEIWTPRFFPYNTIEQRDAYGGETHNDVEVSFFPKFTSQAKIISPEGLIIVKRTIFSSCVCEVDVRRFPFDVQFCVISFTSPTTSIEFSDLFTFVGNDSINININGNSEFEYFNQTVVVTNYTSGGVAYRRYMIVAHLRRYPTYYIVMVVIPTFIINAITITGALMPISMDETTDVIGLGLGATLALIFMFGVVSDTLPKTPGIAWLGYYVIEALILCTVALALGFVRGQAMARMRMKHKPHPYIVRLTRVDMSEWGDDIDENSEKIFTHRESCDAKALKEKRTEIWTQVKYRIALIWMTIFQFVNLLLLLVFFSVAWLPNPAFVDVSF